MHTSFNQWRRFSSQSTGWNVNGFYLRSLRRIIHTETCNKVSRSLNHTGLTHRCPTTILLPARKSKMKRLIAAACLFAISAVYVNAANNSYREAALEAARWIRSSVVKTEQGKVWPSDPTDAKSVGTSLYAGTPGIILFFIEAYRSTGDKSFLDDARAGADQLLVALSNEKESGLYEGISGVGFTLQETFKATGEAKYRDGALRCAQMLSERARKTGKGIEWNDSTDIIGGGAGIGLFLIYAARELKDRCLA